MKVAVLAGGVGGARLCDGLFRLSGTGLDLNFVVNTGDDFCLHGLSISPDLDTVLYTVAGWANPEQGWGLKQESWNCAEQLQALGGEIWFRLGDRDLATHLFRSQCLAQGLTLTQLTSRLCQSAQLPPDLILPMCDRAVPTRVRTQDGWLDFQDYFVRRQHRDRVLECRYEGTAQTPPTSQVQQALRGAERLILAPSNPFLSLLPIMSLQGMAQLWHSCQVPKIAVSPMLGNQAVKGPLASLLESLGHPINSLGVAHVLQGWVDTILIDIQDSSLQQSIEALGIRVVLCDTLMRDVPDRQRLAQIVLDA